MLTDEDFKNEFPMSVKRPEDRLSAKLDLTSLLVDCLEAGLDEKGNLDEDDFPIDVRVCLSYGQYKQVNDATLKEVVIQYIGVGWVASIKKEALTQYNDTDYYVTLTLEGRR